MCLYPICVTNRHEGPPTSDSELKRELAKFKQYDHPGTTETVDDHFLLLAFRQDDPTAYFADSACTSKKSHILEFNQKDLCHGQPHPTKNQGQAVRVPAVLWRHLRRGHACHRCCGCGHATDSVFGSHAKTAWRNMHSPQQGMNTCAIHTLQNCERLYLATQFPLDLSTAMNKNVCTQRNIAYLQACMHEILYRGTVRKFSQEDYNAYLHPMYPFMTTRQIPDMVGWKGKFDDFIDKVVHSVHSLVSKVNKSNVFVTLDKPSGATNCTFARCLGGRSGGRRPQGPFSWKGLMEAPVYCLKHGINPRFSVAQAMVVPEDVVDNASVYLLVVYGRVLYDYEHLSLTRLLKLDRTRVAPNGAASTPLWGPRPVRTERSIWRCTSSTKTC